MTYESPESAVDALSAFLDACPTPHHVVAAVEATLSTNGFVAGTWGSMDPGLFGVTKGVVRRDGSVLAWHWPEDADLDDGCLVIGAHTDSPCLRLKPHQGGSSHGLAQLGIEIYGGVLLNSWLDRDLGVAGVVHLADGDEALVTTSSPVARIPQLAIHLDRDVNDKGLVLHRQQHMRPVWGASPADFAVWLAEQIDVAPQEISGFDLRLFDVQSAAILGHDGKLLASGRLDNQVSCWAALSTMVSASPHRPLVVALFDHEEVGSESVTGAAGPLLEICLDELLRARGGLDRRFSFLRASLCVSADNAHAVHPNYPDRHDHEHAPIVNAGPALKVNANQRYATSSAWYSLLREVASRADVPVQTFVSNNAMPCGSTIGPITATRLGIDTVDIGVPQLSMHSAREMCGTDDPWHLVRLFDALA